MCLPAALANNTTAPFKSSLSPSRFSGVAAASLSALSSASNTFGADSKNWFFYPKFTAAWNFSELSALKQYDWLTFAKLRAAYGVTGKQPPIYTNVSSYQTGTLADGWTNGVQTIYPVTDVLEHRARTQLRATAVTTTVGAFLLELLDTDQSCQQAVVGHVQRIELVETLVGIVVTVAGLDQVKHRLVERNHGQLC